MEKIIILGTAHLGTTPGKCSPDKKFRECIYSREIVADLKAILTSYGYKVFVDYEPLEPNAQMKAKTAKEQQTKELQYRVKFVNDLCKKYGKNNCIYVSIHVNAAGADGKWHDARGWSVYTSPGKTKADDFATCLWNAAKKNFPDDHKNAVRADWSDKDPDYEAALYVLTKTSCAAALTENLFQDNKADVELLESITGIQAVERTHVEGIITYLNSLSA